MAASTTTAFPVSTDRASTQVTSLRAGRRRLIDPASGRALEILGHAIEYLSDELVHHDALISANNPQVEAIQLLMSLNRQIYFVCPEMPSFADRCRSILCRRSV